jgi:hypothetical protein
VVYPTIATIRFSFYDETATKFVGLHNYASVFSTDAILTAFKNNIIWVLVFPFFVTFIGLMVAVLTERIRWATAFKAIIVMPIVFSTTASALVWRTIFDLDPHVGVVNAIEQTVSDWFSTPGRIHSTPRSAKRPRPSPHSTRRAAGGHVGQQVRGSTGRHGDDGPDQNQFRHAANTGSEDAGGAAENGGWDRRTGVERLLAVCRRPIRRRSCRTSTGCQICESPSSVRLDPASPHRDQLERRLQLLARRSG